MDTLEHTQITERLHHPFSPSKLQALEASPYYESENNQSEASLAGTWQHDATEAEHLDIDRDDLSDEQMEAVLNCREFRDSVVAEFPGGIVYKEIYVPIDDRIIHVDGKDWVGTTAGYLDLAVVSADEESAAITDWKFGMWSVEPAQTNLQGIAYLLGLLRKHPKLKKVTVNFVCPHQDTIDSHTFHEPEFRALRLRVETVVNRAIAARKDPAASPCSPTISSCLFCARKGLCKVLAEFALKVGKKYAPIQVPENVTPSLIGDKAASTQLMGIAQLMDAWAKAIRRQITEHSLDDTEWVPDGYTMRSRADMTILDYTKMLEAAKALGVTEGALEATRSFNMTAVHKLISDKSPRGEKKAAVEGFREALLAQGVANREQPVYFLQRNKE